MKSWSCIGLVLVGSFVLLPHAVFADVTIDRTDPVIEHKTFDPKQPPAGMPRLDPNEAAVTQSFFGAETRVGGTVLEQAKTADGGWRTSIKVDTIHMTLRLRITIWLPDGAVPKLINHEEGHREISEHFYKDAGRIARQEAQAVLGNTVTATDKDYQTAGDNALKQAAQELGGRYLGKTDAPAGTAQDLYDELTAHGTNAVKEDRAIRDSIREAMRQATQATQATTRAARSARARSSDAAERQ